MRRPDSLTGLAVVLLATASPAARPEAAAGVPVALETFSSALRDGNPTRLISLWPRKGSVMLFGKKFDHERAASKAKFEDGVFELMRWPREGEKGVAPKVVESSVRHSRIFTVTPEGKPGPVCTLHSKKGGPVELVECVEKK